MLVRTASVFLMLLLVACSESPDIRVQEFTMQLPEGSSVFTEELLKGEITDTRITHLAYVGPLSQSIALSEENTDMFIGLKGSGVIQADTLSYTMVPESIAIPMTFDRILITVPEGTTFHFLHFEKKRTEQDREDMEFFPEENKFDMYFTEFIDCEPYTEKIKSPNTVSRTVLPQDIVPRVSLGTVEAPGPDAVGAHEHPMLDQLFLGLRGNDITVHADKSSVAFREFELLHIPIGSSHWATVEEGKKMYYMWMDFFLTKEGQEWLKTHKPVSTDKKEY